MSVSVGTLSEDRRFAEYFGCGVSRGHSGRYKLAHKWYLMDRDNERFYLGEYLYTAILCYGPNVLSKYKGRSGEGSRGGRNGPPLSERNRAPMTEPGNAGSVQGGN